MSHYPVVSHVGETLRDLLWSGMDGDTTITAIVADKSQLTLEPPFRLFKDDAPSQNFLSLYLFRLLESTDLKNRPQFANPAPDYSEPPLAFHCSFLVTPLTNSAANDQILLARVMQLFYDNAIVTGSALHGLLRTNAEEIRVSLDALSLEDVTKLWSAFMRPYRLSVVYQVRTVLIDSERSTRVEAVRRKQIDVRSGVTP